MACEYCSCIINPLHPKKDGLGFFEKPPFCFYCGRKLNDPPLAAVVPPLILFKLKMRLCPEDLKRTREEIVAGLKSGALIVGPELEVIAFDSEGRLVYPIREVTP